MKFILRHISWKKNLRLSIGILLALVLSSFYGLYTNSFYFFDPLNYIFPILSIVHFVFLYVMWFKITEEEFPDPKMRNIEYALYSILFVYLFKIYTAADTLYEYTEYVDHVVPSTFFPLGIFILILHILLPVLTLLTFKQRKDMVGDYNFEDIHKIDHW
ncbi:hypothetical protein [Spongiimicrobium salis]|uniref:hypothetical protein n=1 Tax=Spongiimicrobium salis TaxID=1667022 RepID=UPI00374CB971